MRRSSRRFVVAIAAASTVPIGASAARAECEDLRPTDPGGYFADDFASFAPATYDSPGGRLRIHYATSGPSAPDMAATPPNTSPDYVVMAAAIGDEALAKYSEWGFVDIRSDGGSGACSSHGGDERIDVYFVDFGGGDGQAVTEECAASEASSCSGYILVEANPTGYPSHETALRTIVPHELFHLVQASYTGTVPPWFSEGSAQWAADRVHPALTDLEAFVPAYTEEAHRSIDNPPGGAATGFLYGTAVWPVFLHEMMGDGAVRAVLERMGEGMSVWDATDAALAPGHSAASLFPAFAAAIAGSGSRSLSGGFLDAAKYEAVPATLVETSLPGVVIDDVLSGFAIRVFEMGALDAPVDLSLTAPDGRVAALVVPLQDGGARLDLAATLPARTSGPALVVVAGTSPSKQDAPFRVDAAAVPPEPETSTGAGASGGDAAPGGGEPPREDGCRASRTPRGDSSIGALVVGLTGLIAHRAKRRRRR